MKIRLPQLLICWLGAATVVQAACERNPRTHIYDDKPVTVYVSPNQRADVIFPEEFLRGAYPENREGLIVDRSSIPNKIPFRVTSPMYSGNVTVDGGSGKTYHLRLAARPDCADSEVKIEKAPITDHSKLVTDSKGRPKGLMWYLFNDKLPSGYVEKDFKHYSESDLEVMRAGSVSMYLRKQMVGKRFVGTTYEVVNRGRTSFRFAIEQLDYSSPKIRESLGIVREVGMLPMDRILGPAPEFVSEIYSASHRGLIFVVSEKQ